MRASARFATFATGGFSAAVIFCTAASAAERSFAQWDADSVAVAGSEVVVARGGFVDFAPLKPTAAIKILEPIVDPAKNKTVVRAGLILPRMSGPLSGHHCTWRAGDKAYGPGGSPQFVATLACFAVGPGDRTVDPQYVTSYFAPMLRTSLPDQGRGPTNVNSALVERANPADYPSDIRFGFLATPRTKRGEKTACLQIVLANINPAFQNYSYFPGETCFSGVGGSLDMGVARYTLLGLGPKNAMTIRIDAPIQLRNFEPKMAL